MDDEDSVQLCFAEVERRLEDKGLDYLVNNAYVPIRNIDSKHDTDYLLGAAVCIFQH